MFCGFLFEAHFLQFYSYKNCVFTKKKESPFLLSITIIPWYLTLINISLNFKTTSLYTKREKKKKEKKMIQDGYLCSRCWKNKTYLNVMIFYFVDYLQDFVSIYQHTLTNLGIKNCYVFNVKSHTGILPKIFFFSLLFYSLMLEIKIFI